MVKAIFLLTPGGRNYRYSSYNPSVLRSFYVDLCFACVGIGIPFPCSAQREQKMELDLLEPKLQMVMCCYADAVNQT